MTTATGCRVGEAGTPVGGAHTCLDQGAQTVLHTAGSAWIDGWLEIQVVTVQFAHF